MVKVIVFDFDGVIVDSNYLKRKAWFEIFPEKEGVSVALISNVLDRTQGTRFEILRAIFTELGKPGSRNSIAKMARNERVIEFSLPGKPNDEIETLVAEYAERYNRMVQKGIAEIGLMPEAKEVLGDLASRYALYLNSATPPDALRETIENLGISHFFKRVFGIPPSKISNLKNIIEIEGVKEREVVFVGDGESDYEAARVCDISFVGIKNNSNNWNDTQFPLISNIRMISEAIKCL